MAERLPHAHRDNRHRTIVDGEGLIHDQTQAQALRLNRTSAYL